MRGLKLLMDHLLASAFPEWGESFESFRYFGCRQRRSSIVSS